MARRQANHLELRPDQLTDLLPRERWRHVAPEQHFTVLLFKLVVPRRHREFVVNLVLVLLGTSNILASFAVNSTDKNLKDYNNYSKVCLV